MFLIGHRKHQAWFLGWSLALGASFCANLTACSDREYAEPDNGRPSDNPSHDGTNIDDTANGQSNTGGDGDTASGGGTGGGDVTPGETVNELTVMIQQPDGNADPVARNVQVTFVGTVADPVYDASELIVIWQSNIDGLLDTVVPDASGQVTFSTNTLTPGWHEITLVATNPQRATARDTVVVGVCAVFDLSNSFEIPLANGGDWKVYGDAYWDAGGWLEMTGNLQGKKGQIFNVANKAPAGDIDINFRVWTGGGTGADGFAMSVIGAATAQSLESLLRVAASGGGLGYAYGAGYAGLNVPAFHIEFDTWENKQVPNGDPFDDPTPENHIAVTLDGNPGNHHLWAVIPTLEDQSWHDIAVRVLGSHVRVSLDGVVKLEGDIPGFRFKGGYIGFSGTTGYYTNFHRFDDLRVPTRCEVPNGHE